MRLAAGPARADLAALALLFAAALAFFAPSLFEARAVLIGDSPFHGIPLLHYLRGVLQGHYSLLWTDLVYAGHPIFAESQGGFLNPLNLFVAALFDPLAGVDVFHFLCTFLCGAGVYLLCRELGCRPASALFAALAMGGSTMWLTLQGNLTISNATMGVPWAMLAFERLLRRPGMGPALWLALAMSYLVTAGYPHVVQGCAVFLFVSLLPQALQWARRGELAARLGALCVPGLAAVLLTAGLSAAQVLPMFELAGESYRAEGVDYVRFPPASFLRGFLFTDIVPEEFAPNFTLLGSSAVSMLVLSGLLGARGARAAGVVLATVFLCYLGFGAQAPGFEFIHRHGLVPGMRYFRLMTPYFYIGTVGACVVAAFGVEAWAAAGAARRRLALVAGSGLAVLAGAAALHTAQVHAWHYASVAACLACALAALVSGRAAWLPAALVAVLAVEVAVLRGGAIHFAPAELFSRPAVLQQTCFAAPGCGAKSADLSINTIAVSFAHPRSQEAPLGLPRALASFSPMTNMLWDVPAIGGAMALQLERSKLATDHVREELLQGSARAPGQRLADVMDVRYVTLGSFAPAPGAALVGSEAMSPLSENPAARGKYQFYGEARFVDSAQAALEEFRRPAPAGPLALVIEGTRPGDLPAARAAGGAPGAARIVVRSARADDMRLDVHTAEPGWLFVADSWYPGWRARVNGEERTVYPAQLMGKAVRLDAGPNRVRLRYAPDSFRVGAWLSGATAILIVLIALRECRLRRPRAEPAG